MTSACHPQRILSASVQGLRSSPLLLRKSKGSPSSKAESVSVRHLPLNCVLLCPAGLCVSLPQILPAVGCEHSAASDAQRVCPADFPLKALQGLSTLLKQKTSRHSGTDKPPQRTPRRSLPQCMSEFTNAEDETVKYNPHHFHVWEEQRRGSGGWEAEGLRESPEPDPPEAEDAGKSQPAGKSQSLALRPNKEPTQSVSCGCCNCSLIGWRLRNCWGPRNCWQLEGPEVEVMGWTGRMLVRGQAKVLGAHR